METRHGEFGLKNQGYGLYKIEIADYWLKGQNCYSGKVFIDGEHEVKLVFSEPCVFATREEAEIMLEKVRIKLTIIEEARGEINRLLS